MDAAARTQSFLIVGLTVVVAGLLALPVSHSDVSVATVYPLMLLPVTVIVAVAGLVAACRPAAVRVAAVICGLHGLQMAGILLVASRDWLNFAGVGEASWERGMIGSRLALLMFGCAFGVVVACVRLCLRSTAGDHGLRWTPIPVIAGAAVAAGLPLVLWVILQRSGLQGFVQLALWSLPWAAGVAATGALPTRTLRWTAVVSVAVSVAVTLLCASVSPVYGFGLRLPEF